MAIIEAVEKTDDIMSDGKKCRGAAPRAVNEGVLWA
jgi:hypothetical protein